MENVWEVVISKYANEDDIDTTAYAGMVYKTEEQAERIFKQITDLCKENESANHFVEFIDNDGTCIDGHGLDNECLDTALNILKSSMK